MAGGSKKNNASHLCVLLLKGYRPSSKRVSVCKSSGSLQVQKGLYMEMDNQWTFIDWNESTNLHNLTNEREKSLPHFHTCTS